MRCVRKTVTNGSSPASHRQALFLINVQMGHHIRELRDVRAERSVSRTGQLHGANTVSIGVERRGFDLG